MDTFFNTKDKNFYHYGSVHNSDVIREFTDEYSMSNL
jgi:hypothetical protein